MKTVLIVSRCPPVPLHLGDRLILWHLARELSQRGLALDLFALYDRDDDPDRVSEYAHFFREIHLFPEQPRTPMQYVRRWFARFPRSAAGAWHPELWASLGEYRQRMGDPDVAHVIGSSQVYEVAHALAGLPRLITPYESYSLYLQRQIAQEDRFALRLQRFMAQQYERFMFTPYAKTVVLAQPDADALTRLNPRLDIEVIPNGVELAQFNTGGQRRERHILLFVGNYEYPPNVDAALQLTDVILPKIREQRPDVALWLVGNEPPPELKARANDHISVTGRVPDVKPYLARATAFVSPLRLGAGLKNKVLEALAMGTPVIATPLSVDGISVQDGASALLCEIDDMAEATLRLLNDQNLRGQLALRGRELIEQRYSWSSVAERYLALYEAIRRAITPTG